MDKYIKSHSQNANKSQRIIEKSDKIDAKI
jgi:hypothetical protein